MSSNGISRGESEMTTVGARSSEPKTQRREGTPPAEVSPAEEPQRPSLGPVNSRSAPQPQTAPYANSYRYTDIEEDDNTLFRRVHPLLLCVIFFTFLGFILTIVAIPTTNWYVILHGNTKMRFGLYRTCENDNCKEIEYRDVTYPDCDTRTSSGWRFRNNVAQGTALTSLVLDLIVFVLCIFSKKILTEFKCTLMIVALSFANFLILGGGMLRFVYTYEHWLFCDKNYCDYVPTLSNTPAPAAASGSTQFSGCDASFGYSFGLICITMGAVLVAGLFAGVRALFRDYTLTRKEEVYRDPNVPHREAPTQSPEASFRGGEPPATHDAPLERESARPPETKSKDKLPAPPPGDWVYHEDCGLYWSAKEFLYLDPYTRHYYDPESDMWYDPDTDQWYEGESI